MKKLSQNNHVLNKELHDMSKELHEMDEFKMVLENNHYSQENFNEKRVDMLKAQISKQQRYIQKLTSLLQTTRQSHKELQTVCQFLTQLLFKQENETHKLRHNQQSPQQQPPQQQLLKSQ